MKRRLASVLLFVGAGASIALGQSPPERERGFKPELMYQFNGIDSVSLFNGNLNLTIPIATYHVAADVSYSFDLRYSGNLWEDSERCSLRPTGPDDPPCTLIWRPHTDNAGLGWSMSMGKLKSASHLYGPGVAAGWQYISPDGAEHNFYTTLHEPVCTTSSDTGCDRSTPGTWYTRDNTYLRMKEKQAGTRSVKIIEFPDGPRHLYFFEPVTQAWRLEYIYGTSSGFDENSLAPTRNWMKVSYVRQGDTGRVDWAISDSHGRNHKVVFMSGIHAPTGVVDYIDLATYYETTSRYDFTYDSQPTNDSPTTIAKPYETVDTSADVRFLRRVSLPSGETWQFVYHEPQGPTADPESGTLKQAVLPTLGKINWSYQPYPQLTNTQSADPVGVFERWLGDATAKVEYRKYVLDPSTPGKVEVETRVGSSLASDSRATNYFDLTYGPTYALPYAPLISDGTPMARKLSTETYDCDPAARTCSSTPLRRQFVKYELDAPVAPPLCHMDYPCARDRNRRVLSERTEYVDDLLPNGAKRYADIDRDEFDGLGHYRTTSTQGNFTSGNVKETFVNFNATTRDYDPATRTGLSVGTYRLTADGARAGNFMMLMDDDSWVLNTYSDTRATEDVTARTEACFDPTTGFLERKRTQLRDDGVNSGTDLLTIFTRDTQTGFVMREELFGGDVLENGAGLENQTLCTIEPSRDARTYRTDFTTQYGVLKTKRSYDYGRAAPMAFFAVENSIIDRNTSLVRESKDPSGLATTYTYDVAGRVKSIAPAGVATTTYTYFNAGVTPATIDAVTGTSSRKMQWVYDAYGRMSVERRVMPDGSWSGRKTSYDSAGRVDSVSEQEPAPSPTFTPAFVTKYTNYDPFGRVGTVETADRKKTIFKYAGDRLTTRKTEDVAKVEGDVAVETQEERDRAGRLIKVVEDATGTKLTTEYGYDVGDRLSRVTIGSQQRRFIYDRRGLLVSETHPESGETSYLYDARGNVTTKSTPMHTLTQKYDRAGRLESVTAGGLLLVEQTYDSVSSPGYPKGKLATATRVNSSTELGNVKVTENFTYADPAGRLSRKDTTVTRTVPSSETYTFFETYGYDAFGELTTIGYPSCTGCGSLAAPARTVTRTYAEGLLTGVAPYTSATGGITYHPNGAIAKIQHRNANGSNGPLFEQAIDSGMTRPSSMKVANVCSVPDATITANSNMNASETTTASVPETLNASYAWSVTGGTIVTGAGTRQITFRAGCTGQVVLTATVTAECAVTTSRTVTIVAPKAIVSGSTTIDQGASATIQATLTGVGPWTVNWNDTAQSLPTSATIASRTVSPLGKTVYTVTGLTDGGGCAGSSTGSAVVTVVPPAPTAALATAVSVNQVQITWSFTGSADRFDVYRNGSLRGSTQALPYLDPVDASQAYVYWVKAVKTDIASAESGRDLATTVAFSDDPVGSGITPVRAIHMTELQNAVNAVRATAGMGPAVFTAITPGVAVEATHLDAIRSALAQARAQLGLTTATYTQPSITGWTITAAHVNETRGGVR